MRKPTLTAGSSLAAVVAVIVSASPALANDFTGTYIDSADRVAARGYWDDSIDTLCARDYLDSHDWSEAQIVPVNGVGTTFTVRDQPGDSARTCTGNLSLPEDKQYRMVVRFKLPSSSCPNQICSKSTGTFYS